MKSNIILVGMPASGKSTIGVILAKTINKAFVDTDLTIQSREGMKLQEIIDKKGNDYFHKVEESVLWDFKEKNYIVATGGSAVYFKNALESLKEDGQVVYLKVSLDTVLERLNNIKTRGVTLEAGQTLEDLYNYRVPMYEAVADTTVECEGLTVEEIVEKIIKKVEI